ncbi:MAG: hypothetical protein H6R12_822 [Proteobacteria bacterium]|nr:hypothetical protein [Pseudomonadota bacterium]
MVGRRGSGRLGVGAVQSRGRSGGTRRTRPLTRAGNRQTVPGRQLRSASVVLAVGQMRPPFGLKALSGHCVAVDRGQQFRACPQRAASPTRWHIPRSPPTSPPWVRRHKGGRKVSCLRGGRPRQAWPAPDRLRQGLSWFSRRTGAGGTCPLQEEWFMSPPQEMPGKFIIVPGRAHRFPRPGHPGRFMPPNFLSFMRGVVGCNAAATRMSARQRQHGQPEWTSGPGAIGRGKCCREP